MTLFILMTLIICMPIIAVVSMANTGKEKLKGDRYLDSYRTAVQVKCHFSALGKAVLFHKLRAQASPKYLTSYAISGAYTPPAYINWIYADSYTSQIATRQKSHQQPKRRTIVSLFFLAFRQADDLECAGQFMYGIF